MDSEVALTKAQLSPIRGSLRLQVSSSRQDVIAGDDFSIFVNINNPFDVPITIHNVQTHIPIELIDVNQLSLTRALEQTTDEERSLSQIIYNKMLDWIKKKRFHSGVAIAVGTDFDPEMQKKLFDIGSMKVGGDVNIVGIELNFPEKPSSDELDAVFQRVMSYQKGLVPTHLQPGDSTVKQFVLRTRTWLLFTPLARTFQIQVNYSLDGKDHSDVVVHSQRIGAPIRSIGIGSSLGAVIGSALRTLTSAGGLDLAPLLLPAATSILASLAVVIAFARRTTAQPFVSLEDFWGGALIGFTVGFFGFEQFSHLFGQNINEGDVN